MHEACSNVDALRPGRERSSKDAIYIGSRSSVNVSAVVGNRVRSIRFQRWKPQAICEPLTNLLADRQDFIVGDYPLRRISKRCTSGRVLLKRYGALGDVIVLYPAVRRLKELLPFTFSLACGPAYVQLFRYDHTFDEVMVRSMRQPMLPVIGEILLDGVLERDLAWDVQYGGPNPEFLVPRVFSYFDFLRNGFDLPARFVPDYSLAIGEQDAVWAEQFLSDKRDRPVIIVQARGSGPMRSIGRERMIAITQRLAEVYNIVIIDQSKQFAWKAEDKKIFCAYGRTILNIIALMQKSDVALVMDSGVLWMAHAASIPTVAVLGPTREEERLSTHPLYPKRTRTVNAARLYNCAPCFESARACKRRFDCLQKQNTEVLAEAILNALSEVLKDGTRRNDD